MKLETSSKIYVDSSKIQKAGRGVFAKNVIQSGERIEQCPVIDLSEFDTSSIVEGTLISYLFYFGKTKERSLIALGYGSIYNHSSSPNAYYKEKYSDHILEFIALKDIKKDEEITVSYHGQKNNNTLSPLWFEE